MSVRLAAERDYEFITGYLRARERALPDDDCVRRVESARSVSDLRHALAETMFAAAAGEAREPAELAASVEAAAGDFVRGIYALPGSTPFALALERSFFDGFRVALYAGETHGLRRAGRRLLCGFTPRELASGGAFDDVSPAVVEAVAAARVVLARALADRDARAFEEAEPAAKRAFRARLVRACGDVARLVEALRAVESAAAAWQGAGAVEASASTESAALPDDPELSRARALVERASTVDEVERAYEAIAEDVVSRMTAVEPSAGFVVRFALDLEAAVRLVKRRALALLAERAWHEEGTGSR